MQAPRKNAWTWMPLLVAALLYSAIFISGTNHALFLVLNRAGHVMGDGWWDNVTIMGDAAIALALVLPMVRRFPRCFWAALIAALVTTILVHLFKHLFPLPRPLTVLTASPFFHSGPQLHAGSFPSGHSATIFTLAGIMVMGLPLRRPVRWLLLAVALLVSASRIMVGVHWPLDVLAGMLIGWSAAYIGLVSSNKLAWETRNVGGLFAALALTGIAAGLLVSKHTGYVSALGFQHLIGLVCLAFGIAELSQLFLQYIAHARASHAGSGGLAAREHHG